MSESEDNEEAMIPLDDDPEEEVDDLLQSDDTIDEEPPDAEITFDRHLPSRHQYLEQGMRMRSISSSRNDANDNSNGNEDIITIPILSIGSITLFPGQTIPFNSHSAPSAVISLLKPRFLFAVIPPFDRPRKQVIGTVAQVIRCLKKRRQPTNDDDREEEEEDPEESDAVQAGGDFAILAVGKYRFVATAIRSSGTMQMVDALILKDVPCKVPMEAKRWSHYYSPNVWNSYDPFLLMKRAKSLVHSALVSVVPPEFDETSAERKLLDRDPSSYSFWLARNLPLDDETRLQLLECSNPTARLKLEIEILSSYSNVHCSSCFSAVAKISNVFNISDEGSTGAYVNSHGYMHEIVTVRSCTGLSAQHGADRPTLENTWFPGYGWTIMYCSSCGRHLGWKYTAMIDGVSPRYFFGLRRVAVKSL